MRVEGASVCFSYAAVAVVTVRCCAKESGRGGARKADFLLCVFQKQEKKQNRCVKGREKPAVL